MRLINEAIIHCSYTKPSMDIGFDEIDAWHKARGWNGCGYHYIIRRNGDLENGRGIAKQGAHTSGHNAESIGICLVGGMLKNGGSDCNFTMAQYETLSILWSELGIKYPGIKLSAHRDYSDKECPCFDANALLGD